MFLSELFANELGNGSADALILVSPDYPLNVRLPPGVPTKWSNRPVFYFNYAVHTSLPSHIDLFGRVARQLGGLQYRIFESLDLLEAWADKRMGSASLANVDVFWWGGAENVMDGWANEIDQRLVKLGTQQAASTTAAN